ncbi:hypothetical protein SLEP1_g21364 [Rubroshorea leprosula]|uniref:Secreted protein n=1 Tax=Rubroshorea leprosula TaxID=152421 RepID=A0AAV5JBT5_9ROSI|nr:hypothetical protein SLEP1_g21364 [Rubroshorea leprosula]
MYSGCGNHNTCSSSLVRSHYNMFLFSSLLCASSTKTLAKDLYTKFSSILVVMEARKGTLALRMFNHMPCKSIAGSFSSLVHDTNFK